MKRILLLAAGCVATAGVCAAEPFFQASLTPDIAIHSQDTRIKGMSLSIWGENPQSGFALGFVNGSTDVSSGFSLAIYGVNYSERYTGVHFGLVNHSSESFTGWQHGMVNLSKGTFLGLQSGLANVAEDVRGVQLGAVNYTRSMHGLQIGLANIIADNGWFNKFPDNLAKGFVLVNWSFD